MENGCAKEKIAWRDNQDAPNRLGIGITWETSGGDHKQSSEDSELSIVSIVLPSSGLTNMHTKEFSAVCN